MISPLTLLVAIATIQSVVSVSVTIGGVSEDSILSWDSVYVAAVHQSNPEWVFSYTPMGANVSTPLWIAGMDTMEEDFDVDGNDTEEWEEDDQEFEDIDDSDNEDDEDDEFVQETPTILLQNHLKISHSHKRRQKSKKLAHAKGASFLQISENVTAGPSDEFAPISYIELGDIKVKNVMELPTLPPIPGNFVIGSTSQWTELTHDDFDNNSTSVDGWTMDDVQLDNSSLSTCGNNDSYLGGYCKIPAGAMLERNYTGLPEHSFIRLTGRVHFFDKWRGESTFLQVDSNTVWTQKQSACTKIFSDMCGGINVCGDDKFPDRLSYYFSVVTPHTELSAIVNFGSTLQVDPCVASYGVDDLVLSVM